jgi:hypothetical protein
MQMTGRVLSRWSGVIKLAGGGVRLSCKFEIGLIGE